MGIGVIIRDERGAVVAAWSKLCQGSIEPTMGEVTALFYAESLCRELGIHEVIFEGDAKQVVDAINSNTSKWSRFGHLIEDTRQMLQFLSRWECVFTK
jgi:ribonuclease HI